jgi:hypothetical protein
MLASLGIALNRMTTILVWGLLTAVLLVAGFLAGIGFGPAGVATGYVAASALVLVIALRYGVASGLLQPADLMQAVLPPIALGAAAIAVAGAADACSAAHLPARLMPHRPLRTLALALALFATGAALDLRRRRLVGAEWRSLADGWLAGLLARLGGSPARPPTPP